MTVETAEKDGLFLRIADRVSFGMGTPTNIGFWLLAVAVWFALGLFLPSLWTKSQFLPAWFTSTSWNFPLNTVTTLAELYIGFLVAAATNRAEKALGLVINHILTNTEKIEALEERLAEQIDENTSLTREVHELSTAVHRHILGDQP